MNRSIGGAQIQAVLAGPFGLLATIFRMVGDGYGDVDRLRWFLEHSKSALRI